MTKPKTAEESADKLWEDCKGASKAQSLPFIIKALEDYRAEGIREAVINSFGPEYRKLRD